jgi:hypothetical protein
MPKVAISNEVLEAAIAGFEEQKRQIDAKISELRTLLAARTEPARQPTSLPRKLSAEGRQRIIAANKLRWAAARKRTAVAKKRKTSRTSGTGPRVGREVEVE